MRTRWWRASDSAAVPGLFASAARDLRSPYEDLLVPHAAVEALWSDDEGLTIEVDQGSAKTDAPLPSINHGYGARLHVIADAISVLDAFYVVKLDGQVVDEARHCVQQALTFRCHSHGRHPEGVSAVRGLHHTRNSRTVRPRRPSRTHASRTLSGTSALRPAGHLDKRVV